MHTKAKVCELIKMGLGRGKNSSLYRTLKDIIIISTWMVSPVYFLVKSQADEKYTFLSQGTHVLQIFADESKVLLLPIANV